MNYPEFIAWVTVHIPDKGQVMVRYLNLRIITLADKGRACSIAKVRES